MLRTSLAASSVRETTMVGSRGGGGWGWPPRVLVLVQRKAQRSLALRHRFDLRLQLLDLQLQIVDLLAS